MPDVKIQELVKAVYDAGCRHFDTAEAYTTGDNYNEATLRDFFRQSLAIPSLSVPAADYETVKPHLMGSLKCLKLDYAGSDIRGGRLF
jgi:aryl-alcohol dehydrogenase-like predicted oxidoreductase